MRDQRSLFLYRPHELWIPDTSLKDFCRGKKTNVLFCPPLVPSSNNNVQCQVTHLLMFLQCANVAMLFWSSMSNELPFKVGPSTYSTPCASFSKQLELRSRHMVDNTINLLYRPVTRQLNTLPAANARKGKLENKQQQQQNKQLL